LSKKKDSIEKKNDFSATVEFFSLLLPLTNFPCLMFIMFNKNFGRPSRCAAVVSRFQKGFTLIEIMVVIAIITVLSAAGIVAFRNMLKSGRDGRRKLDMRNISTAINQYYFKNGSMPINRTPGSAYSQVNADFLQELVTDDDMPLIPKDPRHPTYVYRYYDYGPNSAAGAIIVTQLETLTPTTEALPGSCRPFINNWCSSTIASNYYCICNPY
jgi:prepilin-type N-terminal cleavage/methylation domain-containing protein